MENKDKREQYKELRKQVMALEKEMNILMADIVKLEDSPSGNHTYFADEDEDITGCCGADFHKESDICSKCGEHSE